MGSINNFINGLIELDKSAEADFDPPLALAELVSTMRKELGIEELSKDLEALLIPPPTYGQARTYKQINPTH